MDLSLSDDAGLGSTAEFQGLWTESGPQTAACG